MSRENESSNPPKQLQSARERNVPVFKNFKNKLGKPADLGKWTGVVQTFRNFVCDPRIFYDAARPDVSHGH